MRLIISILLLVAGIAILFFWGRILWSDIQKLQTERDAYVSVLNRLNELKKTRDALVGSYNAIPSQDLQRIKNFMPDTPNTGSLVVQMANGTNESGLLLKNINIVTRKDAPSESPYPFRFREVIRILSAFCAKLKKACG